MVVGSSHFKPVCSCYYINAVTVQQIATVPARYTTRNVTFYDEYLMTLDQNVTRSFPFMTFYIGWYNLATKTRCSSLRQDENCHKLVLLHVVTNAFLSLESNYKRHNFMTMLNCH